jgi:hypothetical protein
MRQLNRGPLRILAVAAAASLLLAACGSNTPTTIVVVATPTPTPEATEAPTEEATPTVEVTATPAVATPTPSPEATPTPVPSPTATSPASACSGSAANQAFFVQSAHAVKAPIYCATKLPAGWAITTGTFQGTKSGGSMDVTYKFKNTNQTFEIKEGAFCLTDVMTCVGGMEVLVQAGVHFGPMTANLASYGAPGLFVIQVNPAKSNAYFLTAHNIAQATVVTIGANMKVVPKG